MAAKTIQERIAETPPYGLLDVSGESFKVDAPDEAKHYVDVTKPMTIIAENTLFDIARLVRVHSRAGFHTRQPDVHLLGRARIQYPEGNPLRGNDRYEGQHGVHIEGAANFTCEWTVANAPANTFYATVNPKDRTKPCTNLQLMRMASLQPGRAHFGLQGVDGFAIRFPYMNETFRGHSAIVFEPNGHYDVCKNGVIELGSYRGNTGFCFSGGSLRDGQPSSGNLANVVLRNMVSQDGPFGIQLHNGPGNRLGPFIADMNEGKGEAHVSQVRAQGVDGFFCTNHKQKFRGLTWDQLFDISPDCTNVVLSKRAA